MDGAGVAALGLPEGARFRPAGSARIAVYSCYFGQHEPFNPEATGPETPACDRYVFTDHADLSETSAQLVPLTDPGFGPAILSRLPKLCPHLFFQDYDWVVYLDNNARFLLEPERIIRRVGREHPDQPAGRYLFRHRRRTCAWSEADECLRLGYLTEDQHAHVLATFRAAQFPREAGLSVNTCLIQRMGSAATDALNEAWFASLSTFTRRDQVMLPYLLRETACPHRTLQAKIKDWAEWPLFRPQARERFRKKVSQSAA